MSIKGVWLPVITPFREGKVDFASYTKLINFYIDKKIDGIIPLGTTGESPAIEEDEYLRVVESTMEIVNKRIPVFFGAGGNYTRKVIRQIEKIEQYDFSGILSVSPYFNRPDQRGIYEHYRAIAESTAKDVILYNIPHRTGRNIENETIRRLAAIHNIVGVKDACGSIAQTMDLLSNRPDNFSVMAGDDMLYFIILALGGDGGIMASAHVDTEKYAGIYRLMRENDHVGARTLWTEAARLIPLLFAEPSPGPLKYILKKRNMIASDETRLPITGISESLAKRIDELIERGGGATSGMQEHY